MKKLVIILLSMVLLCYTVNVGFAQSGLEPMATPVSNFSDTGSSSAANTVSDVVNQWKQSCKDSISFHTDEHSVSSDSLLRLAYTYISDATPTRTINDIASYTVLSMGRNADDGQCKLELFTMDGPACIVLNAHSGLSITRTGYTDPNSKQKNMLSFGRVCEKWIETMENNGTLLEFQKGISLGNGISCETFMRLLMTYFIDTNPDYNYETLLSFEPRFTFSENTVGESIVIANSFTAEGDVSFSISLETGNLMDSKVNPGGNG